MAFCLLVLLLSLVGLTQGCSLITMDLKTELNGNGFHRVVHTELELSSLKRLINCKVSYYFKIPRGAFLDTDGLNVSLLNHCFLSTPFNTEMPANHASLSNHKPVIFQSNIELRKVFVFSDKLEFPLHLRYHQPSDDNSGLSESIVIEPPTVYLHCMNNASLISEESCKKSIQTLACTCKSRPKCQFFRLNCKKRPESLEARVPVGKTWQAGLVTYVTVALVLALVAWVFLSTAKLQPVRITDKKRN